MLQVQAVLQAQGCWLALRAALEPLQQWRQPLQQQGLQVVPAALRLLPARRNQAAAQRLQGPQTQVAAAGEQTAAWVQALHWTPAAAAGMALLLPCLPARHAGCVPPCEGCEEQPPPPLLPCQLPCRQQQAAACCLPLCHLLWWLQVAQRWGLQRYYCWLLLQPQWVLGQQPPP